MTVKLTRPTHKIAIQLHLLAQSCTICSSRSRRPVRKLLDTSSYMTTSTATRRRFHQHRSSTDQSKVTRNGSLFSFTSNGI